MVKTIEYLSLSALAYVDFKESDAGLTLDEIIRDEQKKKSRKDFNLDSPELSALQNSSNPLRSWKIIAQSPSSVSEVKVVNYRGYKRKEVVTYTIGFSCTAFQNPETGEIVFAFRGTNNIKDWGTDIQIASFVPQAFIGQFQKAKDFVFNTLNEHGPVCYETQDAMFKALNQNSNISFTGHSLGGGLAQYMTYVTSDMRSNDIGVKSVTFNGVGIGQNTWDIEIWSNGYRYNSTNHINSGDLTGNYGMRLGSQVYHVDALSGVRSQSVNVKALATMLMYKVYGLTGKNRNIDYLAKIKNIQKSLKDGDERRSTTLVYEGFFEGGGGSGIARYHMLDTLIDRTTGEITDTIEDNATDLANRLDKDKAQKLIGAIKVIEVAKIEGNYKESLLTSKPPVYKWKEHRSGRYEGMPGNPPAKEYGKAKYSYTDAQIGYANYVLKEFERMFSSGEYKDIEVIFQKAQAEQNRRIDPLVFDLDGDGITTVSLDDSSAFFDLDNSGFAEKTSWIGAKEGLLAYDKNGDGIINGGNELFGDRTLMKDGKALASSGFMALAEYDDNKDGKIDGNDAIYTLLRIWQDSDGDGITSAGELKRLVDLGIVSIGLSYNNTGVTDSAKNIQVRTGTFTLADGSSRMTGEYLLNRDPLQSVDSSLVEVSDDVALLPNVQGAGNVGSLHKAIMQDESGLLRSLVEQFIQEKNITKREALVADILVNWTGAISIDPKSRGDLFDAQKLAILEKFFGTEFRGSPNTNVVPLLQKSYDRLFEVVYVSLVSQVQLKDITASIKAESDVISFEDTFKVLDAAILQDAKAGIDLLSEFARVMKYHGLKKSVEFENLRNYYVKQSAEYGRIIDFAGEKVLNGTDKRDSLNTKDDYTLIAAGDGDDGLYADDNDNVLYGDAGNDTIYGMGGDDVFVGGTGTDQIRGGAGDDIYRFSRGDGTDYIEETDGFDTIQLGEGISPNDVVARVVSTEEKSISLELSIVGTKDKIAVNYHFGRYSYYQQEDIASPGNQIERVMFADGTAWDLDEIYRRAHDMAGTDGNDNFSMVGNAPVIYHGLAGNDNISGRSGKDMLYGDAGDDYISGGGTLIGGPGNDRIYGSKGDDVYIFNRGDGQDLITDTGGVDTIRFGDGIRPDDIVIKRVGNGYGHNLELCIKDTDDKVAVYEHFGTNSYWGSVDNPAVKIERVEFADGTVWTKEDIDDKMHNRTGTDGADTIEAYGKRGVVYHGLGGDDNLRGAAGNDQLYGENGDDRISGGDGNDLIVGGRGNDIIDSFRGDDTYVFNRGDGKDIITDYNGFDTVQFGEGIKPEDIVLKRVYANREWSLEMSIRDTEDAVTFISHFDPVKSYSTANYALEQIAFADGTVWTKDDIDYKMHHLTGTEENDQLAAYDKADVVYYGRGGDDNLRGGAGNDKLYGEGGDDQLYGDEGNDLIVGGKGNDTISSFRGDDTYVFNRGDGKDIITDYNGFDTVQFGEGIKPEDVVLKRVYVNRDWSLEISIKDTEDTVTFISHFDPTKPSMSSNHTLEQIKFADGTVWTKEDIDYKMHHLTGTENNDRLAAYDKAKVVYYGRGGNDTLVGSESNDELYGEDGNDTLDGNSGNDVFVGGKGNDKITSIAGDDVYVFSRGDGQDTINDYDGTDTIRFGEGIRPEDIIVSRVPWYGDYNLVLSLKDTDDKITVISHFGSSNYSGYYATPQRRIERFEFADGTVWTAETVDDKMHNLVGTDAKDNFVAYDDKPVTYYGMGGDDTLQSRKGNDMLVGGTGNDHLAGDVGDDTYIFARGDGKDRVFDTGGNDTIRLGHTHAEVVFKKIYNTDLLLEMRGSSDSVQIQEWYCNSDRRIETIQAEDGYTIQPEKVQQLIQAMASFGNSHGMTWQQALEAHPVEAQSIISQYWTAPTA